MLTKVKELTTRVDLLDFAAAAVIGAACGKMVMSHSKLFFDLTGHSYLKLAVAKLAGALITSYSVFLDATIDFVIVSVAIYWINRRSETFSRELQRRQLSRIALLASPRSLSWRGAFRIVLPY